MINMNKNKKVDLPKHMWAGMSNHIHLLLKVNQEDIGSNIKYLGIMYGI